MKTKNFAHRGARSLAPENTLPAISKAWEVEADGIEVDIRLTSDNELILFHDPQLKRTTNVKDIFPKQAGHPVESFTYAALQRLDAGTWFAAADPFGRIRDGEVSPEELRAMHNTRIPLLADLLDFIGDKTWRVNLELKQPDTSKKTYPLVKTVLSLLDKKQVDPVKIIISSFNHDYLREIKTLREDLEINALIGQNALAGNSWGNYEFRIYNANAAHFDAVQMQQARDRGCQVNLYTVNQPEDMVRFMNWGVGTIITDFPQTLAEIIGEKKAGRTTAGQ